jgi:hypothetical protein
MHGKPEIATSCTVYNTLVCAEVGGLGLKAYDIPDKPAASHRLGLRHLLRGCALKLSALPLYLQFIS